jgi:hypothetical protein
MYDYALGGTYARAVDRAAVEKIRAVMPELTQTAWANRGFHQRAAIWMARRGISQFIDLGCGLPTTASTYQAVRKVIPCARVAYVDHDPAVVEHARPVLADSATASVILADARDPASLLTALHLDGLIELAEPTGVLCTAVMEFIADESDPWGCLARLMSALAPGSYLALSHLTGDQVPPLALQAIIRAFHQAPEQVHPRDRLEVAMFFEGLDVVPPYPCAAPALCRIGLWGAEDPALADDASSRWWWAAVARWPGSGRRVS